jgi:hypothetical protein
MAADGDNVLLEQLNIEDKLLSSVEEVQISSRKGMRLALTRP